MKTRCLFLLPLLIAAKLSAQPALEWEKKVTSDCADARSVQVKSLYTHGDTCLIAYNYTDPATGVWIPKLLVYSDRTKYNMNYSGFFRNFPGYQVSAVAPMHPDRQLEDFYVMLGKRTAKDTVMNVLLTVRNGKLAATNDIRLGGLRTFNTTSMRYDSVANNLYICLKDVNRSICYIAVYNQLQNSFHYGQLTNLEEAEVQATDGKVIVVSTTLNSAKRNLFFDNTFAARSLKNILRMNTNISQSRSFNWYLASQSRNPSPWEFDTFRVVKTLPWKYDYISLTTSVLPAGGLWISKVIYPERGDADMYRNAMRYFTEDNENVSYSPNHEAYSRSSYQFFTHGPVTDFTPINRDGTRFLCVSRPPAATSGSPGTVELGIYATNKMNLGTRVLQGYLGGRSGYSFATAFDHDTTYLLAYTERSLQDGTPGIMLSKWYLPDSVTSQFPEALTRPYKMYLKEFITDLRDYDAKGYPVYNKYAALKIVEIDPSDPAYEQRKKIIGKTITEGFFSNLSYQTPTERKTSYWVEGKFTINKKEYVLKKALILRDFN